MTIEMFVGRLTHIFKGTKSALRTSSSGQVEDNLTSLRILATQVTQQEDAVKASERYLNLAKKRYKLGIDSYLNVITAQTTYLVNRQTLVSLREQQLTAPVQLVEAPVLVRHNRRLVKSAG